MTKIEYVVELVDDDSVYEDYRFENLDSAIRHFDILIKDEQGHPPEDRFVVNLYKKVTKTVENKTIISSWKNND